MANEDLELSIVKSNNRTKLAQTIIRYFAIVVFVWLITNTIKTIAGTTTFFSFLAMVNVALPKSTKFAWVVAIISIIINYFLFRRNRKLITTFGDRIKSYETILEPNRTSSSLTEEGETPGD